MKRVVIDTNILVSSVLSPKGNPAQIMMLISFKELQLFYSYEVLDEYKRVLAYERLNIPIQAQNRVIEGISKLGVLVGPVASTILMPDETDRIFYDTAKASEAILITGNTKHFPIEPLIMTPSEFLEKMAST